MIISQVMLTHVQVEEGQDHTDWLVLIAIPGHHSTTDVPIQVIDEFVPSLLVGIDWPSSKHAELGNTVKPKKLQDEPTITLTRPGSETDSCSSIANVTYTVTLTDPDAPSRDNPKWSEMCHWIATGLAVSEDDDEDSSCSSSLALSLTDLEEVMPYKPPGPPEKTGKHRYVLIVFAPANGTTDPIHPKKPEDRQHWGYEFEGDSVGVRKWSKENGLVPVGMSTSIVSFLPHLWHTLQTTLPINPNLPRRMNQLTLAAANFIYSKNKKQ